MKSRRSSQKTQIISIKIRKESDPMRIVARRIRRAKDVMAVSSLTSPMIDEL